MEEQLADAEFAFIIYKTLDGDYVATPDLSLTMLVEREANRQDIKWACNELLDSLFKQELVTEIVGQMAQTNQSDTEKATSSIRKRLYDKGIL